MSDFAWGPKADDLVVGLAPFGPPMRGILRYRFAIKNESASPRTVTLFSDTEQMYRTRLEVSAQGAIVLHGAVKPLIPTFSGRRIEVSIAPGDTYEAEGTPAKLEGAGPFVVRLLVGEHASAGVAL